MLAERELHLAEIKAKNNLKHDMEMDSFVTISGIKGTQFGKDVFTTVLPFKDLVKFLEVFPEVQRKMNRSKILSIKRYVLSGITEIEAMRFFPAITATARGYLFYDQNTQKVAIDVNRSKLSINDGQHRFFGINEAIRELNGQLNKEKDNDARHKILEIMNELKNMVVPIVIFSNLSEVEEKQLFHDTNNLASRPSRSATIRLAQTDLVSKMARELAEDNRYLKHYGVEFDKSSIHGNNENTVLLTTVYEGIKILLNRNELNKNNFIEFKKMLNDTYDKVFYTLPNDLNQKDKYLLSKSYGLKGIFTFVNYCKNQVKLENESDIWEAISKVDWTVNTEYWKKYRGVETKRGFLSFGGSGDHGRVAVLDALIDNLPERAKEQVEAFQNNKTNEQLELL